MKIETTNHSLLLRSVSEISLREKRIEEKNTFNIRFFHSLFSLSPEDFLGEGFLILIADTGREEGGSYTKCVVEELKP